MEPEAEGWPALSPQQRRILAVVEESVQERGYPPTIREIAAQVGLRSASSVVHHLRVLERAGILRRAARSPRAVELRGNPLDSQPHNPSPSRTPQRPAAAPERLAADGATRAGTPDCSRGDPGPAGSADVRAGHGAADIRAGHGAADIRAGHGAADVRAGRGAAGRGDGTSRSGAAGGRTARGAAGDDRGWSAAGEGRRRTASDDVGPLLVGGMTVQVPLVGTVAAGLPLFAEQQIDEVLTLPAAMTGPGTLFALRVRGDSMIDAGIHEGDVVVIRRQPTADDGAIVAALLDDEATIKVLRHRDGHAELVPRNDAYPILPADDATILGKAVCILRSLP